ncbi:hypothetical protein ACJJTC_015501 [Scirpophaga incertulas]
MDEGKLVSDEMVVDMIDKNLDHPDCKKWVFTGWFSKTVPQAQKLDDLLVKRKWNWMQLLSLALKIVCLYGGLLEGLHYRVDASKAADTVFSTIDNIFKNRIFSRAQQ